MLDRRTLRLLGGGVVAVLVAVGCTGDDDTAPEPTALPATTTTVPARVDDGQLVIGVLLPTTGEGSQLGRSMSEGIDLAVDRINTAGGVLDRDVRVVEVDEGGDSSAALGFDTLIVEGVDAIVGPASSIVALADLDLAVSAGVLTCSPTASALALDDFPDEGLFFRTIPSDSLQMAAIAQEAERTGATSVAIGFLDDAYGRGLAEALELEVAERGLEVVGRVGFSGVDEDLTDDAVELLGASPGVVVVLGDADDGARLIAALDQVAPATIGTTVPLLVNDALRGASSQVVQDLSDELRSAIVGIAPVAVTTDDEMLTGLFAANAYDCVNLIALSATQAESDSPTRMATQMASVSVGGSVCRSFESCAERLGQGLQIDYNGPSGNTELSTRTGDPVRGRFEKFGFDEDGRDTTVGTWFEVAS